MVTLQEDAKELVKLIDQRNMNDDEINGAVLFIAHLHGVSYAEAVLWVEKERFGARTS